jgi:arsenate reductase (glutaredoxin)
MIRIYHNNRCSKSRIVLALLEQHGEPFEVINYIDTPPSAEELKALLSLLGLSARQVLRTGEDAYKELHLDDTSFDEGTLVDAMAKHPQLIERPIVVANSKTVIGRPPEIVLDLIK